MGEGGKGRRGERGKGRRGETEKGREGEKGRKGEVTMGKNEEGKIYRKISTYRDLDVYKMAMEGAIQIFEITKNFPPEERYSLTDQIRRSSRSVCANIAEAWRKRRYKLAFISKLNDSETEGAETQVWAEIAFRSGYLDKISFQKIDEHYDRIIGKLVRMIDNPNPWLISKVVSIL